MARISCIICTYNESGRIKEIIRAVENHPDLLEVIVVNDGSSDDTLTHLAGYPDIRLITYAKNRGKTYALTRGITASTGDIIMLLDADLSGITPADISELAAPVLEKRAHASISLRRNSLWIYRLIGLDFVSGERVLPRSLLADAVTTMETLPRWGGEAFINQLIIKNRLKIAVVRWNNVYNVRKYAKVGALRGIIEECRMISDALSVLSLWGTISQNAGLLRLRIPYPSPPRSSSRGTTLQRNRIG
jgi:glycosyltransferase involved in cell wall biosynthesis